ncbi:globin [Paenibacillus sp. IB182496]|uniref:Globin n=1 Tax=Paenibacillus sabuli TaxID=2772509 RepID=A0A927BRR4_9BACL|nr:globin [Paenibacillus sabuli]MBD2844339.1 globin [Paenibacillus sabuli]
MKSYATIYEAIGGEAAIARIVEAFYPKVQADPLLGPLFPADVTPVMEKQALFLTQFFGGPTRYSDAYGHPMMRARHLPFPITRAHADAWLACMRRSLAEAELAPELQELVLERLSGPAYHFINTDEEA